MSIYVAIFDSNGVLLDGSESNEYFNKEAIKLLKAAGIAATAKMLDSAWIKAMRGTTPGEDELYITMGRFTKLLGAPPNLQSEFVALHKSSTKLYRATEQDLRQSLTKIKRLGIYLAVLTDSINSKKEKEDMLAYAGLGSIFDEIFVPMDTGHRKPDREAYEVALAHFKARPENAVFVGHDKDELDGAKLMGMTTISYKGHQSADYAAGSFKDIIKILKSLKKS
ncbi:MAG: HAD hydrolase-like protein [Candidatus Micrarchaeales archaeon]|jgi:FMN phosphatase YigB (HAD superfamily)|uniref:Haloacid dehalogenase domain protein hydrolase n=1 Tax=Candidatus Micrarchaeum acidiphilum ARMAN-2 TaxID=425595 RepID=C7DH42_MICA2|nr:MAG: Haloacid dehalogenase domain protein hydrolase [Candidatus Micrarchaeum acidiphilum ARMAN-2]MCW6161400.1 HAD hydrolase-like protein [Candidatus Micrarchaeales archaeon]